MVCNKSIFYDFFLKSWRNIKCLLPLNSEWTSLGLFVWHFHLLGACSQCSGANFTLVWRPSVQVFGCRSNLVSKPGSSRILVKVYFWKKVGWVSYLLLFCLATTIYVAIIIGYYILWTVYFEYFQPMPMSQHLCGSIMIVFITVAILFR